MKIISHLVISNVATKARNEMHIYQENVHILAKTTQVSDVAHGPLASLIDFFPIILLFLGTIYSP
jgi:hypothetical protein